MSLVTPRSWSVAMTNETLEPASDAAGSWLKVRDVRPRRSHS